MQDIVVAKVYDSSKVVPRQSTSLYTARRSVMHFSVLLLLVYYILEDEVPAAVAGLATSLSLSCSILSISILIISLSRTNERKREREREKSKSNRTLWDRRRPSPAIIFFFFFCVGRRRLGCEPATSNRTQKITLLVRHWNMCASNLYYTRPVLIYLICA